LSEGRQLSIFTDGTLNYLAASNEISRTLLKKAWQKQYFKWNAPRGGELVPVNNHYRFTSASVARSAEYEAVHRHPSYGFKT
jgi:hypothetical protein